MLSVATPRLAPKYARQLIFREVSSILSRIVGDSVFDFYAGKISPALTARRVFARVEEVRDEAPSVRSFYLRPNGHFRGFRAGQHVNLTVEIDGVRHTRCYSPSSAPDPEGALVLTVKRRPGGLVSSWLHDRVGAGCWVELGQAFGDFTLSAEPPAKVLLVAGGSGITPIASIVRDVCARSLPVDVAMLVYGRTRSELIFAEELAALARRHRGVRVTFALTSGAGGGGELSGRFSASHLERVAPDAGERHTFVCGPPTLIDSVHALRAERGMTTPLRTETFAPLQLREEQGAEAGATVRVTAARARRAFDADLASSLLVQAERAGLSPPSGCRRGICFTCSCRKRSGVVRNVLSGAVSATPDEEIRLCVSTPLSDLTLDL